MADVLKEDAEILELKDERDKAIKKFTSALELYKRALAEKDAVMPIDVSAKIEKVQQFLEGKK